MRVLSDNNNTDKTYQNFIQKLDIRSKMLICILCSIVVIFINELYSLAVLLAASFVYVVAHKRFFLTFVTYGALFVMFCIAICCIRIMLIFVPEMGKMGLSPFINPFLRVMILVNVVLPMALSSRVQDILTTLKTLQLPLFIFLPATVMIRFIPSFINDVRQISESMKIKGYRINPVTMTFRPVLTIRLLFAPLVIRALRSSDELSVAAELKGIGYSEKMTCSQKNKLKTTDYYAVAYAILLILLVLVMNFKDKLYY